MPTVTITFRDSIDNEGRRHVSVITEANPPLAVHALDALSPAQTMALAVIDTIQRNFELAGTSRIDGTTADGTALSVDLTKSEDDLS